MLDNRVANLDSRGAAANKLRRHNLATVLNRLHLVGPLSRSELAAETGLNRSTIRGLIRALSDEGLVSEDPGLPNPGPGRPSSVARVRPEGAIVLAVELEVDSIALATVGLGGRILGRVRMSNPPNAMTPETVVARLLEMAQPLMAELPPGRGLVAIGMAVAGVVRRSDGFVHLSPNVGWRDVPIGQLIREGFGVDLVAVANEADMGALGEYRRGAGRSAHNMIYVAGEVGVGAGIIYGANPMLGVAGYAGEAGHTMVNPGGGACRCGARGCWETEVGEEALVRRAGLDGVAAPLHELLRRAEAGDETTLIALTETGHWLGIGIGNLVNLFNPDLIVIGGFYQPLFPFMAEAIDSGAQEIALEPPWNLCTVVTSELGEDALLVGAAELALEEVLRDPGSWLAAVAEHI